MRVPFFSNCVRRNPARIPTSAGAVATATYLAPLAKAGDTARAEGGSRFH